MARGKMNLPMEPSEHEKEKIERLRRAMYSRSLSGMLGERPRHTLEKAQQVVGEDWEQQEPGSLLAIAQSTGRGKNSSKEPVA